MYGFFFFFAFRLSSKNIGLCWTETFQKKKKKKEGERKK